MKILVVGNGGREHALAWKLAQSPRCSRLFVTRPNAGLRTLGTPVDLAPDDVPGLLAFARAEGIDLTVVGPERPLTLGLVDAFEAAGLRAFGPRRDAARLEGSKAFAKAVMTTAGVPTAAYAVFDSLDPARAWVRQLGRGVAVKADGLAAGKGVVLCHTPDEADQALAEMLEGSALGEAGRRVVVEELLEGEEASFIAVCDGQTVVPLASSQDHKRVGEGDNGPNTGGMGAYSPAPVVTSALADEIMQRVMIPTVEALRADGTPFVGFLYAGVMVTPDGIRVLEFNARLGDPEAQVLLVRLQTDLVDVLEAAIDERLDRVSLDWDPRSALTVVMAAEGYPGTVRTGDPIEGLEAAAALPDVQVFHAGARAHEGQAVTAGGRVLTVTGLGASVAEAAQRAYAAVDLITWPGVHFRRDIGWRAIGRS